MGVQTGSNICVQGTQSICLDCSFNADDCILCSNLTGLDYATAAPSKQCKPCFDHNCIDCLMNYNICVNCTFGYILNITNNNCMQC
jgi:hypothetical protein